MKKGFRGVNTEYKFMVLMVLCFFSLGFSDSLGHCLGWFGVLTFTFDVWNR